MLAGAFGRSSPPPRPSNFISLPGAFEGSTHQQCGSLGRWHFELRGQGVFHGESPVVLGCLPC